MRITWVFADGYQLDPVVNVDEIKSVGSTWGSWTTWRTCGTDNVICHDMARARELLARQFQERCNFYIPKDFYQPLGRPAGTKLYDGKFEQDTANLENIVAVNLVSGISDIVLLVGFELVMSRPETQIDRFRLANYHGALRSVMNRNPDVQWVAVDHARTPDRAYTDLANFTCDQLPNVLKLLS